MSKLITAPATTLIAWRSTSVASPTASSALVPTTNAIASAVRPAFGLVEGTVPAKSCSESRGSTSDITGGGDRVDFGDRRHMIHSKFGSQLTLISKHQDVALEGCGEEGQAWAIEVLLGRAGKRATIPATAAVRFCRDTK
jgi:hypothetical protein